MTDVERRHHVVVLLRLDKMAANEAADDSIVDQALVSNDADLLSHDDDPDGYWRDIVSSIGKYELGDYVGARDDLDTLARRLHGADDDRPRFIGFLRNVVALRNGDSISVITLLDDAVSDTERLLVYVVAATSLTRSGNRREAIPVFEQALELLQILPYKRCVLHTMNNYATSLRVVGRIDEALDILKLHYNLVEEVATDVERASWHGALGACYRELERFEEARQELLLAIEGYERSGNDAGAAVSHSNYGNVLLHLGDAEGALEAYQRSAAIDVRRGSPQSAATALSNAAIVYYNKGKYAEALRVLFDARQHLEHANLHAERAYTDLMLARTYKALGFHDKAAELYRNAIDGARSANDVLTEVQAVLSLADEMREHDPDEALRIITEVLPYAERSELAIIMTSVTIVYTQILLRLDRTEEAHHILTELRRQTNDGTRQLDIDDRRNLHNAFGSYYMYHRDWRAAEREIVEALDIARRVRNMGQTRSLLEKLAGIYAELGQWHEAYLCRTESAELERQTRGVEAVQQAAVHQMEHRVEVERIRSEQVRTMVKSLLPEDIIEAWLEGERRVVDRYESVAILFADLAGFSTWSKDKDAIEVVDVVGDFFAIVEQVCEHHGCLKVKTIGDAVLVIAGAPTPVLDPADRCVRVGLEILTVAQRDRHRISGLVPRIGIHFGSVIGGVVGGDKPQWDVWGSDVNLAARMESSGEPGRLHVSERVVVSLTSHAGLTITPRGMIHVKGAGDVTTYWIDPFEGHSES